MTQTMKASAARQQWSQLLNSVFRNQDRIVVEKSGIPVAAVISADDLKLFTLLEEQRKKRFEALDTVRNAFKGIPSEKIEGEVSKAINQVRIEKRSNTNH